ncbi:Pycsar system effector family protein [Variovorax sp. UC122_21]|uniref:Pycsar system effector family protein n=1 Tax=Variovorax sp. UC122_21 TaxID=3374554 RepID=UPI0037572234
MSRADALADARWALERQLAWIASAEVKVGVVVSIQVAMLAGLGAAFATTTTKSAWAIGSATMCALFGVVSLACAAMAVYPRVKGPDSLFFFGKIAGYAQVDYVDTFIKASDHALVSDLAIQVHINAKIALRKHEWVSKAMMVAFMSALPWLVAVGALVLPG